MQQKLQTAGAKYGPKAKELMKQIPYGHYRKRSETVQNNKQGLSEDFPNQAIDKDEDDFILIPT